MREVSTWSETVVYATHFDIFTDPCLPGRLTPRVGCKSFVNTSLEETKDEAVFRCLYGIGGIFADFQRPGNCSFYGFTTGNHLVHAWYGQRGPASPDTYSQSETVSSLGSGHIPAKQEHLCGKLVT